jgi:hypothetical protein
MKESVRSCGLGAHPEPLDKVGKGEADSVAFTSNSDGLKHTSVPQLAQHKRVLVLRRRLVSVWFDAPDKMWGCNVHLCHQQI